MELLHSRLTMKAISCLPTNISFFGAAIEKVEKSVE